MSQQPPLSKSPYIIICDGRSRVAVTKGIDDKFLCSITCAKEMAAFAENTYADRFNPVDLGPMQHITHQMMEHCTGVNKLGRNEAMALIDSLFDELEKFEDNYA